MHRSCSSETDVHSCVCMFMISMHSPHFSRSRTPCKINPAVNSVLSARKPCRLEQTPLKMLQERQQLMQTQTQEDGKSREQSMYCRDLIYSGATEFCFEELRAERYWQKHARKLHTNSPEDSSTD